MTFGKFVAADTSNAAEDNECATCGHSFADHETRDSAEGAFLFCECNVPDCDCETAMVRVD